MSDEYEDQGEARGGGSAAVGERAEGRVEARKRRRAEEFAGEDVWQV